MGKRRMINIDIIDMGYFMNLSSSSQLAYFRIVTHADDEGFVCNPRLLGVNIRSLKDLEDVGLIYRFDSGPILVRHWHQHNLIRKDTFKSTNFAAEKALVTLDKNKIYQLNSVTEPLRNRSDSVTQDNISKEKKSKEKREIAAAADACGASLSDKENDFNLFWESYPNKQDQAGALKAFMSIDTPLETLLTALERHKQLPHWVNDGGAFIPRAENWLRKRRWEDELVTASAPKPPLCGATGQLGAEELAAIQRAMEEEH